MLRKQLLLTCCTWYRILVHSPTCLLAPLFPCLCSLLSTYFPLLLAQLFPPPLSFRHLSSLPLSLSLLPRVCVCVCVCVCVFLLYSVPHRALPSTCLSSRFCFRFWSLQHIALHIYLPDTRRNKAYANCCSIGFPYCLERSASGSKFGCVSTFVHPFEIVGEQTLKICFWRSCKLVEIPGLLPVKLPSGESQETLLSRNAGATIFPASIQHCFYFVMSVGSLVSAVATIGCTPPLFL